MVLGWRLLELNNGNKAGLRHEHNPLTIGLEMIQHDVCPVEPASTEGIRGPVRPSLTAQCPWDVTRHMSSHVKVVWLLPPIDQMILILMY